MVFATLFPSLENVHVIKDVGQLPYHLARGYAITAKIITYPLEKEYAIPEKVDLVLLNGKPSGKYFDMQIIRYLFSHAQEIDILNLYHYEPQSFINAIFYKIFNPSGKIYLKLDNDLRSLQANGKMYPYGSVLAKIFFYPFERIFQRLTSFASIETTFGLKLLQKYYPTFSKKTFYLPNGIQLPARIQRPLSLTSKKENIILTVGRIGTKQKNISFLLQTITNLDLKDWKFILVGPIEKDFIKDISLFFTQFPHLKEKVIFTGPISDRQKIFDYFKTAKIFCLPSLWESFGLVTVEALLCGCYIITSDYASITDILPDESSRTIIDPTNQDTLKTALQSVIDKGVPKDFNPQKNSDFVVANFMWNKITKLLAHKLKLPER